MGIILLMLLVLGEKIMTDGQTGVKWPEGSAYNGMGDVQWEEYQCYDAPVTPKSIPLEAYVDSGEIPDAYEIYRSEDGKEYKKLAVVKEKTMSLKYVDKKVKRGQTYYYKIKDWKMRNRKKYYGGYTSPLKLSAVNAAGQYKVQVLTQESNSVPALIVRLTSSEDNAKLVFTEDSANDMLLYYIKNDSDSRTEDIVLSKYSYDNKDWHQAGKKKAVLEPGKCIYLQFVSVNGKNLAYQISDMQEMELDSINAEYNELLCTLTIRLKEQTAESRVNGEWYH